MWCVSFATRRYYANKCPEIKVKDPKGAFKVLKVEEDKPKERLQDKSVFDM
jgi:hypothetical protein